MSLFLISAILKEQMKEVHSVLLVVSNSKTFNFYSLVVFFYSKLGQLKKVKWSFQTIYLRSKRKHLVRDRENGSTKIEICTINIGKSYKLRGWLRNPVLITRYPKLVTVHRLSENGSKIIFLYYELMTHRNNASGPIWYVNTTDMYVKLSSNALYYVAMTSPFCFQLLRSSKLKRRNGWISLATVLLLGSDEE